MPSRNIGISLRGAIVGFGAIAERAHVDALRGAGLEIAAVVEVSEERREAARAAVPGARLYREVEEMLAAEKELHFVDVCTPPHMHVEVAARVVEAGIHALVEKPLATEQSQAEKLARLAAQKRVAVGCMNNWVHAPILARAQSLARSGQLGALREMEIVVERNQPARAAGGGDNWRVDPRRAGGGILFDHGWHGMTILGRAVPSAPLAVRGAMARRKHMDLAVEDTAEVEIDYEDGTRGRFSATWAADVRRNRVLIRAEAGSVEVENDVLRVHRRGRMTEERFAESLADGGYRATWTEAIVREFVDEVLHPARRGRALDEALTCMELLSAAYESDARGGQRVEVGRQLGVVS